MASGYGRGFEFLKRQREQFMVGGDFMPKLWLREDEKAQFWFLTEGDDMLIPLFHGVEAKKRNGGTWTKDVLCERRSDEDPIENCALCMAEAKGPWPRSVALVYVERIIHPKQSDDPKKQWEAKRIANKVVYLEQVEATWLLVAKGKLQDQIENAYLGISDLLDDSGTVDPDRTPTLLDRRYVLERTGTGAQTQDVLRPKDLEQMPDHVQAARLNAPNLVELIEREFAERKPGQRPATTTSPGTGNSGSDRAPAVDDSDLVDF